MPKLPIRISPGGDKTSLAQCVWGGGGGYTCSRDLRVLGTHHTPPCDTFGLGLHKYIHSDDAERLVGETIRGRLRRLLISAADVKQMQRVFPLLASEGFGKWAALQHWNTQTLTLPRRTTVCASSGTRLWLNSRSDAQGIWFMPQGKYRWFKTY